MNGRCETDPFDRAVDICRICYGEFCWTCLVETKGRNQPMCRECALIVGGLRPRAKPRMRGSKKTVKARREALREAREAPRHRSNNFTFFDAGDDQSFVGFQDPGSASVQPEPDPDPTPAPEAPPVHEVEDSPAVQRLDSIRRADLEGAPEAGQPSQSTPPAPTADQPPPEPAMPAPPSHEPVSAALSADGFEEQAPVGYAPPSWEALASPSDLEQMENAPVDEDSFDHDEPAEFRKPRPFVAATQLAAHQPVAAESQANQPPVSQPAATQPAATQPGVQQAAASPSPAPPSESDGQPGRTEPAATAGPAMSPAPIDGQPSAMPPAEFALTPTTRSDPDEPVHIHDDPWSRTGPEVVSTAPLPRRRPDPKPSEDSSTSPPDWTKAKLPKFD